MTRAAARWLIGGNFQGKGPERNAEYTVIGSKAAIEADALTAGDGGKVIVWSDRVTRFFGNLSARGGSVSGDGGFAEVSGKQHLQFVPDAIDLRAPNGLRGKLLLDPQDITISDSDGTHDSKISDTDTAINFGDDSTTDYKIKPSAFEAINADITLQASQDITVSDPIDRNGSADSTLTLQAGRHLTISANITGTNGAHSFIFEADSPRSGTANDGTGKLAVGSNVTITSNNGDITLIGAAFDIDSTASVSAGTGNIYVAPSQATAMTISSAADNLSNAEIGRLSSTGTIQIGSATTGPTGSNAAGSQISATDITISEALTISSAADVVFRASQDITVSSTITKSASSATTLALQAGRHVTVSANITGSNAAHSLIFEADSPRSGTANDGTGKLTIGNHTITSNNGDITLIGAAFDIGTTSSVNAGSGDIHVAPSRAAAMTISSAADNLSNTEIGRLTSTGTIHIGTATTGPTSTLAAGSSISATSITISQALTVGGSAALSFDSSGTTTLSANVSTDDGDITFEDAVTLGANITVDSDEDNDATDGDITFSSTVNGGYTLTLDADSGGVTVSGTVGDTTALTSLTVTGGSVSLADVATTGAISVTGTGITLDGDYDSNDGDIEFTGAVTLAGAVSVDSDADTDGTDGDITFSSTIDGGQTLTLDADGGAVALQGNVGGTTKLTSLTVDGGQIDLQSVKTTGAIDVEGTNIDLNGTVYETDGGNVTFTGPVDLAANVSVDSDKDGAGTDGRITFSSTIDGGQTLTLDADGGAVALQGNVGGSTKLTSLTVDGGQVDLQSVQTTGAIDVEGTNIDLNGTVYETDGGNVTFTGPVDLAANVSVDSDKDGTGTDGRITFTSTIDGGQTLTLDADGGAVALQGNVGGTTKLTSLTVDGGQVDLQSVQDHGRDRRGGDEHRPERDGLRD